MAVTALFGGTFNPPHIGHYEMLCALQKRSEIEEIWVVPDRIPPHKVCDVLAEEQHRVAMCRELIRDFPKASLCLLELEREGKSYTYDTVTALKERYPDRDFVFVCGGDMLTSFDTWYRFRELMQLIPFLVFRRSGEDRSVFDRKLAAFRELGMRVTVEETVISEVSSTAIRHQPERCRNLLPERVYQYLKKEGIYRV